MGGRWNWERLAAGSGILFVALFIAGFASATEPPSLNATNSKWVDYVLGHTKELKISSILFGLATIAFLWFAGSLAARLRDGGETRLAGVLIAGVAGAVGMVGILIAGQAAAVRIAVDSPGEVKGWADFLWVTNAIVNFPTAVVMGAVAIATLRSGIFPQWYGALAGLAAVVVLFGGGALAQKGFYSPDGGYILIANIVFAAWTLVTSALMVREAERAPRAAAVPA
jgi:hypothetical protein